LPDEWAWRPTQRRANSQSISSAGACLGWAVRAGVQPLVTVNQSAAAGAVACPEAKGGRWRLMFDGAIAGGNTINFRAFALLGVDLLTETWIYRAFG
jgi:glucan biosynthesis protein